MKELVFSVENIFDSSGSNGCLAQYQSGYYHIPAYQRGYKWGSEANGAVRVLLQDLWAAFEAHERQEKKEYYLQYITVKRGNVTGPVGRHDYLEVIDGQQRLTTLSILISVLATLLDVPNSSASKLHYAIRQDFFTDYIYDGSKLRNFVGREWPELEAHPDTNKQDIYYLHAAARHLYRFLEMKKADSLAQLIAFNGYLAQHVKLIVNSVEAHVPSETVFKNLNSNKVPLTETELIKALVITKVGRVGATAARKGFREVMEARLHLGRRWDELSRWANTPEISTFYFNGYADGMHQFLKLVAYRLEEGKRKLAVIQSGSDLPLFNFYSQYSDIGKIYAAIKETQALLTDWYTNSTTYNLLGFCRFVKESNNNDLRFLKKCLSCATKPELQHLLNEAKIKLLPSQTEIVNLQYGADDDNKIHAALLALSVFAKGVNGASVRFNFHEFTTEKWSLEHIFPQSPEGKDAVLNAPQKAVVKEMMGASLTEQLGKLLDREKRDDSEKSLYYEALQTGPYLNTIGNMCLLTGGDNASNGCLLFQEKRRNVLKLVRHGSFVPKHTFDVFSKMLEPLVEGDTTAWTVADIDAHRQHIEQYINQIINQ